MHSPKCGSGNRPIDKAAALYLLEAVRDAPAPEIGPLPESAAAVDSGAESSGTFSVSDIGNRALVDGASVSATASDVSASPFDEGRTAFGVAAAPKAGAAVPRDLNTKKSTERDTFCITNCVTNTGGKAMTDKTQHPEKNAGADANGRYGVFDLETRRSAAEVGGWHKAWKMGVSCACLFDSASGETRAYLEEDIPELIEDLQALPLVVGFNIKRFDYTVLKGYSKFDFKTLGTLDILEHVHARLGYRLSLDHLAQATLGAQKSADGLQALEWWKQGRIDDIVAYCKQDVAVTRALFLYGRDKGHLLFTNKAKRAVRLPVSW